MIAILNAARKALRLHDDERYCVIYSPHAGLRAMAWWVHEHDPRQERRDITAAVGTDLDPTVDLAAAMEDAVQRAVTALRIRRSYGEPRDLDPDHACCDVCDDPTCYRNAAGAALPF